MNKIVRVEKAYYIVNTIVRSIEAMQMLHLNTKKKK